MHSITINAYKEYIVIWYKPLDKTYYYKYVTGFYQDYYEGLENQYGHIAVFVLKVSLYENFRAPLKHRLIRKLISFLEKRI